MAKKATKAEANYRDEGSKIRRCGLCVMFRPPGKCTAVQGEINEYALCDYFQRKSASKPKK